MFLIAKNFKADGATVAFRIAAHGSADGLAKQATAAADKLLGVFEDIDRASGERVDVIRCGPARVQYGGNVSRGDPLVANAAGKAVTAAPAAGANVQIIGFADVAGVDGDIVETFVNVQSFQG